MIEFPSLSALDAAQLHNLGQHSGALVTELEVHARGGAWLAGIDAGLARVRLDARRGLASARQRVREMQALGPGRKVVWILPNAHAWGLDPAEARTVADEAIAVDAAFNVGDGDAQYTVVIGTVRRDVVGFLLTVRTRASIRRVVAHGRRLIKAGIPIAAVLITQSVVANRVASRLRIITGPLLRGLYSGALLGVWLRDGDDLAESLQGAATLFRSGPSVVARQHPMAFVHQPPLLDDPGVDVDLSWGPVENPVEPPQRPDHLDRQGAWLPAGAYRALAFDPRMPAATCARDAPLRIVRTPAASGFAATWARWRGPRVDLEPLLDYYRFESYLTRVGDVALAHRYHEFKVFAPSGGGPEVRTTLIELDDDVTEPQCALMVDELRQHQASSAGTMTVAGGAAFLDAARLEAAARLRTFGGDVLERQRQAHEYLETIASDAPLRADVQMLIDAMPEVLGRTLELGAGTGRLARALASRAAPYVCVDLQAGAMPRPGDGILSLVSDVHRLAVGGAAFECVIANNVLEHAADPVGALREVRRVLTPGGRLYALIPLDGLNSDYDLPAHLWKADMIGIRRAAAGAGLQVHRADLLNLYGLAIPGAFPSCHGWVCLLVAGQSGA